MPLKKDSEKKTIKKNTTSTKERKTKSIVLEVQNKERPIHTSKNEECKCKKYHKGVFHVIEIILLIANLIVLGILTCKVSQINNWTIILNGGIENYKQLQTVYESDAYKEYINNEILDLEEQLNEISN